LTVSDISALDTDKRETILLSELHGVVGVLDGLESHQLASVSRGLVDMSPVYGAGDDFIVGLKQDGSVPEIVEQGVDGRLDVQRVEPEGEDASLALTLCIKIVNFNLLFLCQGIETRVRVEEMSDEGKVEFGVSSNQGLGREELATSDLVGVLQNLLCTFVKVVGVQRGTRADVGHKLIQKNGVILGIRNIFAKVAHATKLSAF
jgi:hypothetical protein